MAQVDTLLRRARAYAAAHGIELTTVSKDLFGDWRRLAAIATGNSFLRPPTLQSALARMTALESGPRPDKRRKVPAPRKRKRRARKPNASEAANARDA